MRIGLIIYGNLDILTGGYLYDRMVFAGLMHRGHQVEVISLFAGSYLQRLRLNFSLHLGRRLLTGEFDILIEDELCHPSLFLLNRWLRRHHSRPLLLALVHHTLSDEPRHRWQNQVLAVAERSFLASVDGFILNSETTRQRVAELLPHSRPEVVAYPAGDRFGPPLAPEHIFRRARQAGPLRLLFLGNVIPRKGLISLIHALSRIDQDCWRLSIVGGLDFDPLYTKEAQQLACRLGLAEAVVFLGPLEDDELIKVLSLSHIFCMPYAYEGFGIAILEAMAFGLPAIGCRHGAAGETIKHGINGYLLAQDDISGLLPLLTGLHQNREELLRLAMAARTTYQNHPGWQDGVDTIDNFLLQLQGQQD